MDMFDDLYRSYPTRPRYYHHSSPMVTPVNVNRQTTPASKVVSIPVHYVGSERSRADSATKIQKVFRGFLARKNVKKIAAVRKEVNEIEKRILMKETVDLIRIDSQERLKVNEMLMNLLFRLDSVRGVDSGVRECRRTVIKKAIRLQEMVDAIVASDHIASEADVAAEPEAVDREDLETRDKVHESEGTPAKSDSKSNSLENAADQTLELQDIIEPVSMRSSVSKANAVESENIPDVGGDAVNVEECADNGSASEEESEADSSASPQSLIEGDGEEENDSLGSHERAVAEKEEEHCDGGQGKEVSRKSKELLEKMMEDNEKMMGLMAELFQRNETQTRLLSSLSQRVEHLERALMCERLKKKKKRNALH
ncbi:hypothetical protein JCGZ_18008 [Jatropha curcas]|uniref:BAG domain-containing protein n=1 Tax=Jatropha curcas TaxID=180498 RepID=A0A067K3M0_JATCU|nr:hypothetical protein JCGZ_18008 [Jatropha curcas]